MAYLRAHGESILGIGRGGLDKRGKFHGAELSVQCKVAIERSRDSDGRGAGLGHERKTRGAKIVDGQARTRAAAGVKSEKLAIPMHEHHAIATESIHHGFGYVDHRGHGDSGIRGVSSRFQYLRAQRRRERLAGTSQAILCKNRST